MLNNLSEFFFIKYSRHSGEANTVIPAKQTPSFRRSKHRHSGERRNPGFNTFWIPTSVGMTFLKVL
jgi:hypothetical protein